MDSIRVLIVDDSVVFRSQIRAALEGVGRIEVAGVAANGRIALEKLQATKIDLIILDLEMPEMNGIETLRRLAQSSNSPKVIVFSSTSKQGAQITLEALTLGAADFVPKPGGNPDQTAESLSSVDLLRSLLVPKIKDLFAESSYSLPDSPQKTQAFRWSEFLPKAVVIGSSTGGPMALEAVFSKISGPFRCPVFIAQHMPPIFTASLAARLGRLCGVPADEGRDGELVTENRIYLAPGDFHMQIAKTGSGLKIVLNQEEQENFVRPAVDQLFRSAAQVFRAECLGMVLTGMGRDGLSGGQMLRKSGNPVVIQSRESCVVFGMPGALFQASEYDSIQNLDEITATLRGYLQASPAELRRA